MRQLILAVTLLVSLAFVADANAQCTGCPGGACCGFVDCGSCNSGSFCARCVAYSIPGVAGCGSTNGNCMSGSCGICVQSFSDTDCISYARCGGMVCAAEGCFPGMAANAIAAEPCVDCETLALTAANETAVPIEALQPLSTPVKVLAADAPAELPGRYRVRNDGTSPLVALISVVTYVDKTGRRESYSETTDSWSRGRGFLAPGEERDVPLMTAVASAAGIARVVIRPVYAEFEDGTQVGVKAGLRRQCMRLHRRALLERMRELLAAYRSGGENALKARAAEGPRRFQLAESRAGRARRRGCRGRALSGTGARRVGQTTRTPLRAGGAADVRGEETRGRG